MYNFCRICSSINPSQNPSVAIFAFGEGWHNYHHVFPWDYKTAELGDYKMNATTAFIDFFAKIGWAYDLKSVSDEVINSKQSNYLYCLYRLVTNEMIRLHFHRSFRSAWNAPVTVPTTSGAGVTKIKTKLKSIMHTLHTKRASKKLRP